MNNSKLIVESVSLASEETLDRKPYLREREGKLVTILDAVRGIMQSREWSTLKTEVFDGLTATLNKELTSEAKKETPDALKLNRLSGQLKWAERYSDLSKLEESFRTELTNVRKMLYGKTKEND